MARSKPGKENFLTFSASGDQPSAMSERDLGSELYKKSYQNKTIDLFEKNLGITPKRKKENRRYKTKIFSPEFEKDQELLGELMNKPQYRIELWKDTWTMEGSFKIFILYSEDLDFKTEEEKTKIIAEGPENE